MSTDRTDRFLDEEELNLFKEVTEDSCEVLKEGNKMKKWEYKTEEFSHATMSNWFLRVLNREGEKGWEAVQVLSSPDGGYSKILFKREKKETEEIKEVEAIETDQIIETLELPEDELTKEQ